MGNNILNNQKPMPTIIVLCFAILLSFNRCSSSDDKKEAPEENIHTASFRLTGNGYNDTFNYNSTDNLIFCRLTGSDMWIRLAQDKAANGENAPHIDIDICNYAGAGTYMPVDPQNRPCPAGLLWDIFWHDGDKVYSNQADSSPCELTLTLDGDTLTGVFNCNDVILFEGDEIIEITQGSFTCKIE